MCDHKDAVVLVIDDNIDNLYLMELLLTSDGYKVETASCGCEGIEKIHQLIPDLIILDMMMPDMTGLEVIDSIEAHHHLSHIPILLCTANTYININSIHRADHICYKPIDLDDILAQVHTLIPCCDRVGETESHCESCLLSNRAVSPTFVLDVDDWDPLYSEYEQLTSNFDSERATLEALQKEGYKIVES